MERDVLAEINHDHLQMYTNVSKFVKTNNLTQNSLILKRRHGLI